MSLPNFVFILHQKEKSALKEHNDNLLKLSLQTETKDTPDDGIKFLQQVCFGVNSLRVFFFFVFL